jgi:MFS family permease
MREALTALRRRPLWPVWLATIAFSGLVAVFMTFATVSAEQRGIERAPSLWLTYALGAISVRAFGARLPDRVGPANLVAPALGLYVTAMVLAASATTFSDFLWAAALAGAGHGTCFPVLTSQVVTRSPEAFRGSALALFTALWGASELLVSPVFGVVADRLGDGAMFNLAAVSGILCLAGWLLLEHRFGVSTA